jgi:hypothetical protein
MSSQLQSPAALPHYRAVSMWTVLSILCAVGTVAMFFGWAFAVFPLAAIYCGRRALEQIRRTPEEFAGLKLATIGVWLGAGLGVVFSGWLIFGRSEVPHGYQPLDYSILEPDQNNKGRVPNAAQELSNNKTKVYVRGYMLPPERGQWTGTKFSICRMSDRCPYAIMNSTRPEDEIHVEMAGDRTMKYTIGEIGVGGYFSVDSDQNRQPYYLIKADYP